MRLVTIIIPAYNHERYIGACIESAIAQTYSNLEILIIDDGSQDGTGAVARSFGDNRIRYYHQKNKGAHAALNRGLTLARGDYVALLNSDDMFHPQKIETAMNEFEKDRSLAMVVSDCTFIDANAGEIRRSSSADYCRFLTDKQAGFYGCGELQLELLTGNFLISTSNPVARTKILLDEGGFANLRYVHDWDLYFRISRRHKIRYLQQPLFSYRYHGQNTIRENKKFLRLEEAFVLADHLLNLKFSKNQAGVDLYYKLYCALFPATDTKQLSLFLTLINRFGRDTILKRLVNFETANALPENIFVTEISGWEILKRIVHDVAKSPKLFLLAPLQIFWVVLPRAWRTKIRNIFRHIENRMSL